MSSSGRIERIYYGLIEAIAVVLFCAMLSCMVIQVFFRYVLVAPLVWIEELSQFLLIWSIFWGAVPAHRRGLHPSVDFLVLRLPGRAQQGILVVAHAVTLGVLGLVLVYGVMMMKSLSMVRSAAMNLPWIYVNAVVPMAALLMLPHQARLLLQPLKGSQSRSRPSPSKERG
ncbi:MAG: TRAP transporter small permease [Deltaproteobacteria bacterium]|nr:TRAP transporter small permease [Deltaproteobacteria bacterium]